MKKPVGKIRRTLDLADKEVCRQSFLDGSKFVGIFVYALFNSQLIKKKSWVLISLIINRYMSAKSRLPSS